MTGASQPRPRVVLASASAGRAELLTRSGIDATAIVSAVDERALAAASGLAPTDADGITVLLATEKAREVAANITGGSQPAELGGPATTADPILVIGADSMLSLGDELLGKASGPQEVLARWERYAQPDTWADLVTGHAVVELPSGRLVTEAVRTRIRMAAPTRGELAAYLATGEPLAVAGSATIDGFGAAFLAEIQGDPSNVIGLSLPRLRLLVADLGYEWCALWRPGLARSWQ